MNLKARLLLVLVVAGVIPSQAIAQNHPILFEADKNWNIDFKADKAEVFIIGHEVHYELFMSLAPFTRYAKPEEIPRDIRRLAAGFEDRVTKGPFSLIRKNSKRFEKITGKEFSGEAAVFELNDDTLQVMFLVSAGVIVWNGSFQGSRDSWREVKILLREMTKNPKYRRYY